MWWILFSKNADISFWTRLLDSINLQKVSDNNGANLRSLRERNGLSLQALGKSLDLSQTRIAQIEKADYKSEINPIYLKIFCLIFHVSPWYFLDTPLLPPSNPDLSPMIDPMVFYDDKKEQWIRCIIQNLSSEDEDAVGNNLLAAFVNLSKEKNSTLRKIRNKDGSKQQRPDLFADIIDILSRIPRIPNPDSFELDTHPSGHPVPLEWTGERLSDADFKEWENRREQFFQAFDALSKLYDRSPRLVQYLLCISTCDDSVQEMVYQVLDAGGFLGS